MSEDPPARPLAGPGSASQAWYDCLPSRQDADWWAKFEKRRHRMQPPDLFDEAVRKFDKFAETSFPSRTPSPKDGSNSVHVTPSSRRFRLDPIEIAGANRNDHSPDAAEDSNLSLRKALFFDSCLRADRAVGDPVQLLPTKPLDQSPVSHSPPPSPRDSPSPLGGQQPSASRRRRRRSRVDRSNYGTADSQQSALSPTSGRHLATKTSNLSFFEPQSSSAPPPPTLQESMSGFINSCKQAKVHPSTTGIIRGAEESLQMEFGSTTDVRAEVMAEALKATSGHVKEARLRSNGLTAKGAKSLLQALPRRLEMIDLAGNDLNQNEAWCSLINKFSNLHAFSVADCQLGDPVCKALCESLLSCSHLTSLNLSGNTINNSGISLGYLVRGSRHLAELDLHWNRLSGEGAKEVFKGLSDNCLVGGGSLRRIDFSWNPLGKNGGDEVCFHLAQMFQHTKVLKHVDLSMCELSMEHCRILSEGLDLNHTILGVHMAGNSGKMTSGGRLVPTQEVADAAAIFEKHKGDPEKVSKICGITKEMFLADPPTDAADFAKKLHAGVYRLPGSKGDSSTERSVFRCMTVEQESGSGCWVCECWKETRITYSPGITGPAVPDDMIWVFTSVDGFSEGLQMIKTGEGDYVAFVMAPGGSFHYVFQVGSQVVPSRLAPVAKDLAPGKPAPKLRRIRVPWDPVEGEPGQEQQVQPTQDDAIKSSTKELPGKGTAVEQKNEAFSGAATAVPTKRCSSGNDILTVKVRAASRATVISRERGDEVCQYLIPRQALQPTQVQDLKSDEPTHWDIDTSLFAPYEEALLRRNFCDFCFDSDWHNSKCDELFKNESDRGPVRELFRVHYAEIYVLLSSLCSVDWKLANQLPGERTRPLCFGVGVNEFTHMVVQHNLTGDEVTLEELDAIFVLAAIPSKDSTAWNAAVQTKGRLLLRHNFFELLLRLAIRRHNAKPAGGALGATKGATLTKTLEHLLNKQIMWPYPAMKHNLKAVQWREDVLHSESVERVLRSNIKEVLEPLFLAFAVRGSCRQAPHTIRPEGWFALLDWLDVLQYRGLENVDKAKLALWDRSWLWRTSVMARVDEVKNCEHLELSLVEFLEIIPRLLALLRSREHWNHATQAEVEKWDYGLGLPSPSTIFCIDKEGVMDKDAFAQHLSTFLKPIRKKLKDSPPKARSPVLAAPSVLGVDASVAATPSSESA